MIVGRCFLNQVKRIKTDVKYKITNDFGKVRMLKKGALARDKFRSEKLNENKEVVKMFLDSAPKYVV